MMECFAKSYMTKREQKKHEEAQKEEQRLLKEINDSFCDAGIFEVIESVIFSKVSGEHIIRA